MEGLCESDVLMQFLSVVSVDPRIGPMHISIYAALLFHWKKNNYNMPLRLFSREVKQVAKISSTATYYRFLNQLAAYGYIRYLPSYNRVAGSEIYIL